MKDNFLLKREQRDVFEALTDEEAGKLIKGIFKYLDTYDSGLTGTLKAIFIPIKKAIDDNEEKYKRICERNKQNGLLGGRPKNETQKTQSVILETQENPKKPDNNHISYITNHLEEKKDIRGMGEEEKKETFNGAAKASKHKYGEFKNVLLKDEELQALKETYSNYEELIKFLDEYIEEKGYKAKSHYLSIKRWVVQAVSERDKKQSKQVKSSNPFREIAEEEGLI